MLILHAFGLSYMLVSDSQNKQSLIYSLHDLTSEKNSVVFLSYSFFVLVYHRDTTPVYIWWLFLFVMVVKETQWQITVQMKKCQAFIRFEEIAEFTCPISISKLLHSKLVLLEIINSDLNVYTTFFSPLVIKL